MDITYPSIASLIVDTKVEGNLLHCRFQAPGSERIVEAQAPIAKSNSVKNKVIHSIKRSAIYELRRAAYSLVGQVLGRGMVGRTARSAVSSTLSGTNQMLPAYSEEDKEQAAVKAFQSVAVQFIYDEQTNSWRAPQQVSAFERQLMEHPIRDPYDQKMLRQMVVHLAGASDGISDEEKLFIEEMLNLTSLEIDELYLQEPVLAVECEEISADAKASIFLLVYAVALADKRLDAVEKAQLDRYAQMLELTPDTATRLANMARQHILEGALRLGSGRERILELARNMDMNPEEALRTMIRYQRRH